MQLKDELQKPISGQFTNSIFWLGIGAALFAVPILAIQVEIVNRLLPPADAAPIKDFVFGALKGIGGAFIGRSLLLTALKGVMRVKETTPAAAAPCAPDMPGLEPADEGEPDWQALQEEAVRQQEAEQAEVAPNGVL